MEIWSHRLQILEKDIQWRCAVKDCESWKKTSSGDVESSSFKTRGLKAEEPTEEKIKEEEEEMRDFKRNLQIPEVTDRLLKRIQNPTEVKKIAERKFQIPEVA